MKPEACYKEVVVWWLREAETLEEACSTALANEENEKAEKYLVLLHERLLALMNLKEKVEKKQLQENKTC